MKRLKARASIYFHWLRHNHHVSMWEHPISGGLNWFCIDCYTVENSYFGGSVK